MALFKYRDSALQGYLCNCLICGLLPGARKQKAATWWNDVRLLCDPDDEVGELIPALRYEELDDVYIEPLPDDWWLLPPPNPSRRHMIRPRENASAIEIHKAEWYDGPAFFFDPEYDEDGVSRVVNIDNCQSVSKTFDGRAYLPVHARCLEIAQKSYCSPSFGGHIHDLRGLFTALRWRHGMQRLDLSMQFADTGNVHANYKMEGQSFYLPVSGKWYWYRVQDDHPDLGVLLPCMQDPTQVGNMTEVLIRNLQRCPARPPMSPMAAQLRRLLSNLPDDVWNIILGHLVQLRDFPLSVEHVLPQSFWKEQLKAGSSGVVPWLWDIDPSLIEAKASELCDDPSTEWNWELLVRQLTANVKLGLKDDFREDLKPQLTMNPSYASDSEWNDVAYVGTGYHTIMTHVPPGLHNRRRIWQLVEEMFVGDMIPQPPVNQGPVNWGPEEKFVQLYWTKSGELRDEPIWIPSMYLDQFCRKTSGRTYTIRGKAKLQYWQYEDDDPRKPDPSAVAATREEVAEVLKKLGYPL